MPAPGPVYRLSLFYQGEQDFVQYYAVEYVPDPAYGPVYVHDSYVGGTGRWYRVTVEGERLMSRLLPALQRVDGQTESASAMQARSEQRAVAPAAAVVPQSVATRGLLAAGPALGLAPIGGAFTVWRRRVRGARRLQA